MGLFLVGQTVALTASFDRVDNGTPRDPAEIKLRVKPPQGTPASEFTFGVGGTITKDSIGRYRQRVLLSKPGQWKYHWEGNDGDEKTPQDGTFTVTLPLT